MPSKSNYAANATSRLPFLSTRSYTETACLNLLPDDDRDELALNSAIASDDAAIISSWQDMAKETAAASIISLLVTRLK